MSETGPKVIELERLLLDEDNPRFPKARAQDEILQHLAIQRKTLKLATHIAEHGLNPLERTAVVPSSKGSRYIVLEGNRRLAAVRLLNNPNLAADPHRGRYERIRRETSFPPPQTLSCEVFKDRAGAREWILVKHAGELEGAGTVRWDAMERGRFNIRSGLRDQYAPAYRFLDYGINAGWITEEEANDVTVSNLARVLKDTRVQELLGVSASDEGASMALSAGSGKRLTRRLVKDWSREGLTVATIYKQKDREVYARHLQKELRLKSSEEPTDPGPPTQPTPPPGRRRKSRAPTDRRTLIPPSFDVSIPRKLHRVDAILTELQRLNVETFTNAAAVLFRTFIEASVRHYLSKRTLPIHQEDKLRTLTERALTHLEKDPVVKAAVKPVRAAISTKGSLFSIGTLNEYVHNPNWHPVASDLRKHWDNYTAFIEHLWE